MKQSCETGKQRFNDQLEQISLLSCVWVVFVLCYWMGEQTCSQESESVPRLPITVTAVANGDRNSTWRRHLRTDEETHSHLRRETDLKRKVKRNNNWKQSYKRKDKHTALLHHMLHVMVTNLSHILTLFHWEHVLNFVTPSYRTVTYGWKWNRLLLHIMAHLYFQDFSPFEGGWRLASSKTCSCLPLRLFKNCCLGKLE